MRTTKARLNHLVGRLNEEYIDPKTRECNLGHISLYKSHYGWELQETMTLGGGVRNIGIERGMTAREVECLMVGLLVGLTPVDSR
jgi:hypothetical protein